MKKSPAKTYVYYEIAGDMHLLRFHCRAAEGVGPYAKHRFNA